MRWGENQSPRNLWYRRIASCQTRLDNSPKYLVDHID